MITKGIADMWDYLKWMRLLHLTARPDQHHAMQVLERRGKRFLVHFGIDNAVELAR